MATWLIVLIALLAFNAGFLAGAWWRANFADEPPPYQPPIPADDTYGRTARYMMEGR